MMFKSRIKWAALLGLMFSLASLAVHLFLAKASTSELVHYNIINVFVDDLGSSIGGRKGVAHRKLWDKVKTLESLLPYSTPRTPFLDPSERSNGFIYAKISGGFEKIRTSIADLVVVSRLLNVTLVIPELQESGHSRGISGYVAVQSIRAFHIYNADQFRADLKRDVGIVKSLPSKYKEGKKKKLFPILKPPSSASPSYYAKEVLPLLKKSKVIELVISDGGCLQYKRSCRIAFARLLRTGLIFTGAHSSVDRLRASGEPYLAYHPGLVMDTLAYHGCAVLFQDLHTELIQHWRRAKMIKRQIVRDELSVDSHSQKLDGSYPLMPEEVGLILRSLGYPPTTRIYLAGEETFGGQRVVIPLRAMYTNLVDRTSLCSKRELLNLVGPEMPLENNPVQPPPVEKKKNGTKLDLGLAHFHHFLADLYTTMRRKAEPEPSPNDLREQAHRLLWAALDYLVSVEAEAFISGFHNDGSLWPDFSSLVMGHRVYEMGSWRTYRPNRKYAAGLFSKSSENLYHPKHKWTLSLQEHLNKSLAEDGLLRELKRSKSASFLSYPIPECSCRSAGSANISSLVYRDMDECLQWMENSIKPEMEEDIASENEPGMDEEHFYGRGESVVVEGNETMPLIDLDVEMDADD
ncbi:EMBRYO SAC DEVELOPMENT ARREST 30-like protein [Drosera capensis]